MSYCEVAEQMPLGELKKLVKEMEGCGLAAIILNMLWANFSEIQAAGCLGVHSDTVGRFKDWIKSGNPDDAWS